MNDQARRAPSHERSHSPPGPATVECVVHGVHDRRAARSEGENEGKEQRWQLSSLQVDDATMACSRHHSWNRGEKRRRIDHPLNPKPAQGVSHERTAAKVVERRPHLHTRNRLVEIVRRAVARTIGTPLAARAFVSSAV